MKPFIGYYGYWVVLTYVSAVSAVVGIGFAFEGNIKHALVCLMVSGLCDTLDGRVASLKKRSDREKNYGIEIDSLADILAFGALPAAIGYSTLYSAGSIGVIDTVVFFMYVLAALIRLAYFNVMEGELQGTNKKRAYYEGMPVTVVALIIPLVYSLCNLLSAAFHSVYTILLALLTIAFIMKIKFPKPGGACKLILCLIGLPVIIYILLAGGM